MMGLKLLISHFVEKTNVLGPFERSAVWVHGCCFSCEGCMAKPQYTNPFEIEAQCLADKFCGVSGTEGVTISGGEPFLQADALAEFLEAVTARRDYGVIIYTGFGHEELVSRAAGDSGIDKLLGFVDILIDGPYVEALDDAKPYRGSSNQRIIQLSERYAGVFDSYYSTGNRRMEINVSLSGTILTGIPSKAGLEAWKRMQEGAV